MLIYTQLALLACLAHSPGRDALVVCIDAGHPSEINDGFDRVNGITETHANWVVAQALRRKLERAGVKVVMTKQSERERVTNVRRAEIANRAHAALMIRLHCDSGGGSGYRVYYPADEGKDGKVTGPASAVRADSGVAAEAIHAGLAETLAGALRDNGVASDRSTKVGRRYGALIGSIHSKVPAVTVEMVVLDSKKDAAFIKSSAGQEKLAAALAAGVQRYLANRERALRFRM